MRDTLLHWRYARSGRLVLDVVGMIATARSILGEGGSKDAAQLLTEAIYDTNDPDHIAEIRELAEEGRRSANLRARGPWNEVIRLADVRENAARASGLL